MRDERFSFSGMDMAVLFDWKIISELCELEWEEDFYSDDDATIKGTITCMVTSKETSLSEWAKEKKSFHISLSYLNQYGESLFYRIYDCLLLSRKGSHRIDDVSLYECYSFKAKRIEKITEEKAKEQGIMYQERSE